MSRFGLFGLLCLGISVFAHAQDTTLITNTTNTCINSTFKSWSPNMTSPVGGILIDKFLTVNPMTNCTIASSNNADCGLEASYVSAFAEFSQHTQSPSCAFNCGCGTITINDVDDGLPVELMEFGVHSSE